MIRVILDGRSGNNMFQYAAGRAIAIQHHTNLVLDGSWADVRHARQFEQLLRLPLNASYERRFSLAKRALRKMIAIQPETLHRGQVHIERYPKPDPAFYALPDNSLLIGFFQMPFYFNEIEPLLRKELDLTQLTLPPASLRFEDRLRAGATVSVHVRRGDYVGIDSTQCLDADYHERALQHFRDRIPDVRFCVFSDDIPWCRARYSGPEFVFCELEGARGDPLHDLRLMSSCHHHIVVNSSYSWWGAWLNPSPDKIVIVPSMWMTNVPSNYVFPPEWTRIP